jgi:hypothetical protein
MLNAAEICIVVVFVKKFDGLLFGINNIANKIVGRGALLTEK